MRGHHGDGAFAIAAIERLVQVCLLRLGRDTGRRTGSLYIHHHQREFGHDSQAQGFGFQGETRTGSRGHSQVAGIGGSNGGADTGNLVLCL